MIFPASVLPVSQPVSYFNPIDNRAIFVAPWEGATLFGTTDVDHDRDLRKEPLVSEEEIHTLINLLKKAVSTESSLSPRERIKGMSRIEALRFAISDNIDQQEILYLFTEISNIGPKPAEILTDVRKRLSSE